MASHPRVGKAFATMVETGKPRCPQARPALLAPYLSEESSAFPEKKVVTSRQPLLPAPCTWKQRRVEQAPHTLTYTQAHTHTHRIQTPGSLVHKGQRAHTPRSDTRVLTAAGLPSSSCGCPRGTAHRHLPRERPGSKDRGGKRLVADSPSPPSHLHMQATGAGTALAPWGMSNVEVARQNPTLDAN